MAIVAPCNNDSTRWGRNSVSKQFISLASSTCLQNTNNYLHLGECNIDQGPRTQKWRFATENPTLKNSPKQLTVDKIVQIHKNGKARSLFMLPPVRKIFPEETIDSIEAVTIEIEQPQISSQSRANDSSTSSTTPKAPTPKPPTTVTKPNETTVAPKHPTVPPSTPIITPKSNSTQIDIKSLPDEIKKILEPFHEQFKIGLEIEHENKLAKEIRQVFCQLSILRRLQAITLAQTNGILAATALQLPTCSRLQGLGQSLLLQECVKQKVTVSAKETKCGFQPFTVYKNNNYTIGMDGWSLHPFSKCFWKSNLINLNGKTYHWEHSNNTSDWIEQTPNIHTPNLNLISSFDEIPLNDYDFSLKGHPAHSIADLEQLNVLNDLIGHIEDSSSNSLSQLVMSEKQENKLSTMSSWLDGLKVIAFTTIGIIIIIILATMIIAIDPLKPLMTAVQRSRNNRTETQYAEVEQIPTTSQQPIPHENVSSDPPPLYAPLLSYHNKPQTTTEKIHSHNHCSYVVGRGMVWEDLCPCNPNE